MELVVVFFKQKTAYEMRISDWSSDVCSSDLSAKRLQDAGATALMIAANSMHKPAEAVGAAISIPLLHIVDETGEKMRPDGVRTAAVIGTRNVMTESWEPQRSGRYGLTPDPYDLCRARELDPVTT